MSLIHGQDPGLNITDTLNAVTNPPKTSRFHKLVGAVAGGVGNMVLPGVGGAIRNTAAAVDRPRRGASSRCSSGN
jgi:hypothetical protein